jgi:hypothetical protein
MPASINRFISGPDLGFMGPGRIEPRWRGRV